MQTEGGVFVPASAPLPPRELICPPVIGVFSLKRQKVEDQLTVDTTTTTTKVTCTCFAAAR